VIVTLHASIRATINNAHETTVRLARTVYYPVENLVENPVLDQIFDKFLRICDQFTTSLSQTVILLLDMSTLN